MNSSAKERLKQYLATSHPKLLAGYEFHFKPGLRAAFGGPFNGQSGRQQIFRDLLATKAFRAIIETGAYRGTTTEFMAQESGLPIYTVEAQRYIFHYAQLRLREFPSVHLSFNDSRKFLETLATDPAVPKQGVFFYLDAHWGEDLPLRREVELITQHWREVAIMVDDFQVNDDPAYTFDDYGPGKRLCLDYLAPLSAFGLQAFFPTLRGEDESGKKRGSVVLVDQAFLPRVASIASLRPAVG
jgi:hypothetical protein